MLVNLLLQDGMSFSNELRIDGSTLGRTNYMEGLMRTSAYMPMHELIGFSHVALLCYCSKLCSILMPFLSLQPMCICKLFALHLHLSRAATNLLEHGLSCATPECG